MPTHSNYPLPQMTQSHVSPTREVQVVDERGRTLSISIPVERALTVYLDKFELVTLMTMGGNPEALVLGYLRNQRLIRSIADIAAVQVDWDVHAVAVTTRHGVTDIEERTSRRVVTTGCGQGTVFGGLMDEVDQIQLPTADDTHIRQSSLYRIVDTIRLQQSIYKKAGSVHGCALFSSLGELLYFVEDVGRHNAVDAIAGKMWLSDMAGGDKIFYTTGRLTSEMVIKTAQMGIPIVLSRSGTTEMGLRVAEQVGMSLFSRCTGRHFLLLSHAQRLKCDIETDADSATKNDDKITRQQP